ncbi:hypothetical protein [Epilithonimonas sp.]|uniref:hypothetical protein n=1 Tax=Epilithonimonas sp. TaxID=2894511 RepID=UPI00289EAB50|nr:hypothetical protein [Epilithonimonas sp.]
MLDLNNPRTEIIFKASSYTDKLKNYCGKYTIENFENRKKIFLDMLVICDEFEKFYNTNYSKMQWGVKVILETITIEIEKLSTLNNPVQEGNCNVCGNKLFIYKSQIKEFGIFYYCHNCPKTIIENINELETITGAIFI